MPLTFQLLLYGMIAVAIAVVVVPLVRGEDKSWPTALVAALVLAFGATLAYSGLSSWHWPQQGEAPTAPSAGAVDLDLGALEARTRSAPDDVEGWALLGLAYLRSQRASEAVQALDRAQTLSAGTSADITLALVDALIAESDANRPRVNQLIEDLLFYSPSNPRALLYGAELAFARGDYTVAIERWQRLLDRAVAEAGPQSEEVARVLRSRIAVAREQSGAAPAAGTDAAPNAAPAGGLTVEVDIESNLRAQVGNGDMLFVIAREPGGGGPPVAVVRRPAATVPFEVTLSDRDAMMPSRVLSAFERIEIVARVARGGTPQASSGDLYGTVTVDRPTSERVRVVISQVYP